MNYAELICKTNFSFLEGASHAHELVTRASELGLTGLAITDRNGVYAIPRAFQASKSLPTLKLITGSELSLKGSSPIPSVHFLAQTRTGYGRLCRIVTTAHAQGEKGDAGLSIPLLIQTLQTVGAGDLICIPRLPLLNTSALEATLPNLTRHFADLQSFFPNRFFLPRSRFLDGWDRHRDTLAQRLFQETAIPFVITNDVLHHTTERKPLHDILTSIRRGEPVSRCGLHLLTNSERALKSGAELAKLFPDHLADLHRTVEIAHTCIFSPAELRYRYPSEWIPHGHTAYSYLHTLTLQGAALRYPRGIPDRVQAQIQHELQLIQELHFADYFLTLYDIVAFAKKRQILCQGRGSAANSVVCYCLGITAVDPVQMNLLFERFISAERGEPPDIDVDFEHERREEVIQYIYQRYGRDRAGMVSAVITYRSRMAKREISKALELPLPENITQPLERRQKVPIEDPDLLHHMETLIGFPRHLSIHSGGFTLSADPLIETVPIEPARMEGRTIVQWDKLDLEIIGLLKVDILALGILTALRKTMDDVNRLHAHSLPSPLSLATIPPDDPATYTMIQKADTVGTFQIESRAQMSMLPRLLPKTYYDLVVQVAIVRPGPIQGGLVHPYLRRRRGLEPATTPDPRLDDILAKTLGVPLFQEQVMKIAMVLAHFTPGEADTLRRAIGAWRSTGSITEIGLRLKVGLIASGLTEAYAEQIFKMIQGFAEYGFPESHAASFAHLAYASAYLKCHYPAEFVCALLNSQPMGFYANHTLVDEAKRHGVHFHPVDLHDSGWDSTLQSESNSKTSVRLGFHHLRNWRKADFENLQTARTHGRFTSLYDFVRRTRLTDAAFETLASAGLFGIFQLSPRQALWELLTLRSLLSAPSTDAPQQLELFAQTHSNHPSPFSSTSPPQLCPITPWETAQNDYQHFRLSLTHHPMKILRTQSLPSPLPKSTALQVRSLTNGRSTETSGLLIVRQRPPTAKGLLFATLEDETGLLDLVIKPDISERYQDVLNSTHFIRVQGRIQRDAHAVSLNVSRIAALFDRLS